MTKRIWVGAESRLTVKADGELVLEKQRRNTTILSIASADQDTGYIYGAHLNFDESMDDAEVSEDMVRFGDHQLAEPFRRYARVWLERDYEAGRQAS